MPIYEFQCGRCKKIEEKFFKKIEESPEGPVCGSCNFIMKFVISQPGKDIFPFEGVTLEHVESTPKHFKSYSEMKKYAKEHDMELGAVL